MTATARKPLAGSTLVLVHGLWMRPAVFGWLSKALARQGADVRRYYYPSTSGPLMQHAADFSRWLHEQSLADAALVGHSLGGLVIAKALDDLNGSQDAPVVFLGSPLRGSHVARNLSRTPLLGRTLGKVSADLCMGCGTPKDSRPKGMIAGNRRLGIGMIAGGMSQPSDGTVHLRETEVDWVDERIVLPVTHTSLIFSSLVVQQIVAFILHRKFQHPEEY